MMRLVGRIMCIGIMYLSWRLGNTGMDLTIITVVVG